MSNVPADLKYTDEHEWIRTEADGTLTIGITDHAQSTLGDIVFLELPQVGKQVKAGDAVGVVESVKAASDIYSPVSGEVVAINADAVDSPEEVNSDAYDTWLFKIKLADGASTDNLLDAAAYAKLVG
ncbi:glycine cleavage system protein H [Burkholderia ubonensis]|uniref:glycine cleavage system protein GcvH n=1 Tax=Burkholderia ubonensis TaxID=101571 RepID=UPI00075E14BD|nr:glycine cleavage system protein GcvH [Burkholderia ubonensis]KVO19176.1 glycine cleavage system protein H [Burkholderia ubonensis]KVO20218.1 glycine cleavage system protein H [Burkholderia ubonensis]KVQ79867.1 glycine cleavage system protein H [Burkholderia ubonensis]KVU56617.1 glycine cleavage system protein H [Burkholderia ubonensis]KWA79544.1 glycine cleavage system protein H [Burkholderia ubonensis]